MANEIPGIEYQRGAKMLLRNPNGEILFLQRSSIMTGETELMWDVPGGRLDVDPKTEKLEHPFSALFRELSEETLGILLDPEPELIATQEIDLRQFGKQKIVTRETYTARAYPGVVMLSDEHRDHLWASPQEALSSLVLDRYLPEVLQNLPAN